MQTSSKNSNSDPVFIIEDFVTIEQDWYLKFYFKILDKDFTCLDSVFIVNKF